MKIRPGCWIPIVLVFAFFFLLTGTYIISILLQRTTSSEHKVEPISIVPDETPIKSADLVVEPFKKTVTEDGQSKLEIYAMRAEIDQKNNKFKLKDIRNIEFYGSDDRKYIITADEGSWDRHQDNVEVNGNIKGLIQSKDKLPVHFSCDRLTFNRAIQIADGSGRVKITYGPYMTEGDSIAINLAINLITVDGRVISHIDKSVFNGTSFHSESSVTVMAQKVKYHHDKSMLEYLGLPYVTSGENVLRADRISLEFGVNYHLIAESNVHLKVMLPASDSQESEIMRITASELKADMRAGEILFRGQVQIKRPDSTISAEEIRLQMDNNSQELIGITANNNVLYRNGDISAMADHGLYNPIEDQLIISGQANINYGQENKIEAQVIRLFPRRKYYVAEQDVRVRYLSNRRSSVGSIPADGSQTNSMPSFNTEIPIDAECQKIELDEFTGKVKMFGGVKARQAPYTFDSDFMNLSFDPVSKLLLTMDAGDQILMSQNDQIISGDKLHYDAPQEKLILTGNATYWRGKNIVKARSFEYQKKVGDVIFKDDVSMQIESGEVPSADPNIQISQGKLIYLTADHGKMNEMNGEAEFHDNVVVDWDNLHIKSDNFHIFTDKTTRAISRITAEGNVSLEKEEIKGTGSTLTYNAQDYIIVLRGSEEEKCKIWTGERGSQGDEFKYFLGENRFTIEKGLSVVMPSEISGSIK